MNTLKIGYPGPGTIPETIEVQESVDKIIVYVRDDDTRMRCIVCGCPSNHMVWHKIERTGEHHYVCKECEDTIPC